MGEKLTCPGCGAHTSSVLSAVMNDEPCPYCGLSSVAILEIKGVRATQADERLKRRITELLQENSKLSQDLEQLRAFRFQIETAVETLNG